MQIETPEHTNATIGVPVCASRWGVGVRAAQQSTHMRVAQDSARAYFLGMRAPVRLTFYRCRRCGQPYIGFCSWCELGKP